MYSGNKYLFYPIINSRADYNRVSGGLPHSEILGSKPILGSPKLIAEYHVLHRLLLPRHPPNALLALDLIQKKQGLRRARPRAGSTRAILPDQKHTIPLPPMSVGRNIWLVYLTWTTLFVSACILPVGRGNTQGGSSPQPKPWHKTEITCYFRQSNSVDYVSLCTM